MERMSRWAWYGTVAGACLAASIIVTWPLALHMASAVPLGTESAATIPVFDVWTLWWSGDRLLHGYVDLWNAPIFHPTAGAFSFSEPMILPGALAAPLFAGHAPAALAHNLVLLLVLAANGVLACRLACGLGLPRAPALMCALFVVTLPFLAKLQGELPILAVGGALAALDGVVRFGVEGRTRHAAVMAAGLVAQWLSCEQLALFAFLFVGAAGVVALAQQHFARPALARLGGATLAAGLVIYLVARVPIAVHQQLGFTRTDELVQSLSASPLDFLSRPFRALVPFPPREDPASYTGGLFPGFVLIGLGIAGGRVPGRWRWFLVGSTLAAFFLALGLNVPLGVFGPVALLRHLPGFAEIRSVFRAAVFVQIPLAVLAAQGLFALWRRRPRLAPLLGLVGALENLSVPASLLAIPEPPAWTRFLAEQPRGTVVAHVPFSRDGTVESLAPEAWRMLAQIAHRQPLVNGYASNFPALNREFMFAMGNTFPDHALACALYTVFGAQLLVVDADWLAAHGPGFAALGPMFAAVHADPAATVFRFQPAPVECPPVRLDVGH